MRRWTKHCLDWLMNSVPLFSTPNTRQDLHFSYEKSGLTLSGEPIPWNADAVLVEAGVRLPRREYDRRDFFLRGVCAEPIAPEAIHRNGDDNRYRIVFRLAPLTEPTSVELHWRKKSMGHIRIPYLSRDQFLENLLLQAPTLAVNLGRQTVACRSFVSTQSKGLVASAMLTSPTPLAPLVESRLEVEFRSERGGASQKVALTPSSSQLQSKQALLTACPYKLARRIGPWKATWFLDGHPLAEQRVRAVSKPSFERSLRVRETRYVVQDEKGEVQLLREPPELDGTFRLGPCFLVNSRDAGMTGLCTLQTRALLPGAVQPPLLTEAEVLISDGPTAITPGTMDADDLRQVTGFELRLGNRILGVLPMTPAPSAQFDSEGGFKPAMDYTWSSAAEDQLAERLAQLMEE